MYGSGVDSFGSGTPIYFLHGFPLTRRALLPLERWFSAAQFRRVYIDLPGFGDATDVEAGSTSDVVSIVSNWISTDSKGTAFGLVGYSYGGLVARGIAAQLGTQVAGMCLIAPVVHAAHEDRDVDPAPDRPIPTWYTGDNRDQFTEFLSLGGPATKRTWSDYLTYIAPDLAQPLSPTAATIEANYGLPYNPEAQMDTATQGKTLFILGRQDTVVGYRDACRLAETYTNPDVVIINNAGHNLHIDSPWLVGTLIREWGNVLATRL